MLLPHVQLLGASECVWYLVIVLRWPLIAHSRSTRAELDRQLAVLPRSFALKPSWAIAGCRPLPQGDRLWYSLRALGSLHSLRGSPHQRRGCRKLRLNLGHPRSDCWPRNGTLFCLQLTR